jgi:hypothetical protein
MRVSTLALAVTLICPSGYSWAQTSNEGEKAAPQEPAASNSQAPIASRYSFNRVDNGFIRLDSTSGEIAYCSAQTTGWICQNVPIDRTPSAAGSEDMQKGVTFLKGLEEKLGRLQDEVASLKKEVAALREPPPPRPPADLSPQSGNAPDITIKLPTQEDVTRARDFLEETWRRLVEMFGTVRKDIMRKT